MSKLDVSQSAVLTLPPDACAAVLGAHGTGKTTTLIEFVARRVLADRWSPSEVLALTASRSTATALRDALADRLGIATSGPLARTVNSIAFDIVGHDRKASGGTPPRLLTGSDQDSDLGHLLTGHLADCTGPAWPEPLGPDVRRLRGFRTELRELMMRASEYGVSPNQLRALGQQHGHPEWVAAADFTAEYLQVMGGARPDQLDSAELVRAACVALAVGEPGETVSALKLVVVDDVQEAT
ncbi:MAG: UvrD-helicase domain-containing protein, partial [Terrimesophilobacter sp.]